MKNQTGLAWRPLNHDARPWDLSFIKVRPWSWTFDRERGVVSNSVDCRQKTRSKVYLPQAEPVRQFYHLESRTRLLAYRADRMDGMLNCRSVRAACWIAIAAAVAYFGVGIAEWMGR